MSPIELDERIAGLVGQTVDGRYRIDELIGAGGMGAVFRAHHVGLEQDVALKVLHPRAGHDGSAPARFKREAKSASRLDHPNCVRVTDFGALDDGTMFLVMQLLTGHELKDELGRSWPVDRALATARQILEGLEHAHQNGVVHRDLKPENVFITRDHRGEEQVKLVDFGIAKVMGDGGEQDLTRTGVVFGTPKYMSPEQASGSKVDARSDLYTVGLILFEMLHGSPPFEAEDAAVLLRRHILTDAPALPDHIPPGVRSAVARLLEKSRKDRFQNAREVLDALEPRTLETTSLEPAAAVMTAQSGDTLFIGSNASMQTSAVSHSDAVWAQPSPATSTTSSTSPGTTTVPTGLSPVASSAKGGTLVPGDVSPAQRDAARDRNPVVFAWMMGSIAVMSFCVFGFGWAAWKAQGIVRMAQPPVSVWAMAGLRGELPGAPAGYDGPAHAAGFGGNPSGTTESGGDDDGGDEDGGDDGPKDEKKESKKKKKKAKKKKKKKKKGEKKAG